MSATIIQFPGTMRTYVCLVQRMRDRETLERG
jgi:hypothetical protein